jgi:hypothetical protein
MYRCDECNDGFPRPDIPLEESRHRIRMFHILQYLEEDDFLFIGQGKWETCDDRFHEFSIEWERRSESGTLGNSAIFFLDSPQLELEEFTISELFFRTVKCLERVREVYIANICVFGSESLFHPQCLWDIIRNLIDRVLEEVHLLTDPSARDIVQIRVYWDDFTTLFAKMFDISTIPRETTIFIFCLTIEDNDISWLILSEDHATVPPHRFRMRSIFISDDCLDEELLIPRTLLGDELDPTLHGFLFSDIDQRKIFDHITLVLDPTRKYHEKVSYGLDP